MKSNRRSFIKVVVLTGTGIASSVTTSYSNIPPDTTLTVPQEVSKNNIGRNLNIPGR